jgi:uncharacterized SAM-binding protein YcdF (DUF218 family)
MSLAVLQLVVFAMPPVAHQLQSRLEREAADLAQANVGPPYEAILLLGGMARATRSPLAPGWQPDFTEASDRALHAAKLWYDGTADKVIISGGVWPSTPVKPPEAVWLQQMLLMLGLPQTALYLEPASTTTRENVANSAKLMQERGWSGRLALVTSASHMPRAIATAKRAGLSVDAYPTDWQAEGLKDRPLVWLPTADALDSSTRSLKEWIALLWRY